MSKITPGPWRIEVEGEGERYVIHGNCGEPEGHDVSNIVAYIAGRTDQSVADAHLICSAPDLLEALKSVTSIARAAVLEHCNTDRARQRIERAEAAIAKAEGRT